MQPRHKRRPLKLAPQNQLMNRIVFCLVASVLVLSGCGGRKTDARTELEKAAVVIAKTESAPAPAAPETAPAPAVPDLAASAGSASVPAAAPVPSPAQQMQTAMASYKAGELEDAVTRLQKLRASPALTAEQRMALQDGVAAVMMEIYSLAEKGDPKAIAAVKQYELMQTSRQ